MQVADQPTFILASASPRRRALLASIGIEPGTIHPAHIDETPLTGESPKAYVARMAQEKARAVAGEHPGAIVLGADTIVLAGRRILGKPGDAEEARAMLRHLSGRRHQVLTAIAVIDAAGTLRHRTVTTRIALHRLDAGEIEAYIASGEWRGKAGAYAIQGKAAIFVRFLNGSYTNVVGLPLAETARLLKSAGLGVTGAWRAQS